MKAFLRQLRARGVIRVGIAYLVAAWVMLQVVDVVFPALGLPGWAITFALALLGVGFPIALVLAWAFDITPDGVRATAGLAEPAPEPVPEATARPTASGDPSIAVIPFPDMSAEQDQAHFCDGLTEELLNVLTEIPGLRVASRTSCFALKNKDLDLAGVASRLGVANVLEGSVRKSGDRLRITAQLVDVESDSHLWSETYDRELDDIFAIQDDIANHVLEALRLQLGGAVLPSPTTESAEAYAFYLSGRGYRLGSDRERGAAEEMYLHAVEADPGFVRAWVQLGLLRGSWAIYYGGGDRYRSGAYEASERALALAPDRAECYLARGVAHLASQRYPDAEADLAEAIRLDPSESRAHHFLGRAAYLQGHMDDALRFWAQCTELDEDDYESPLLSLAIALDAGSDEEARRLSRIGIERAQRRLEEHPDTQRALYLGAGGWLVLGESAKAEEWANRALALDPDSRSTRYNVACILARAGRSEEALDLLENSILSRRWIQNDPDLASLRTEPRFQSLIESLPE